MPVLLKKFGMFLLLLAAWDGAAFAATVQRCSRVTKTCVINLEEGLVGDRLSVLNDRAQPIAVGKIIKRDRSTAVVNFKKVYRDVKRGYPVIVDVEHRGQDRELGQRLH